MKLEEGMYVRTKNNGICKLYREFHEDSVDVGIGVFPEIDGFFIDKEEINYIEKKDVLKASYNIIDLIEEGDYVNDMKVTNYYYVCEQKVLCLNYAEPYEESENIVSNLCIKSIVTKEQFDSMKYEVDSNE